MATHDYIMHVINDTKCYEPSVIKEILAEQYSVDASIEEINSCLDLDIEDIYLQRYHSGLF